MNFPPSWFNLAFLIRYEVQGYNDEVNTWFSNAIGRPCILSRCFSSNYNSCLNKSRSTGTCRDVQATLNFVNEAQLLLISEDSVADLNNRLSKSTFLYCTLYLLYKKFILAFLCKKSLSALTTT